MKKHRQNITWTLAERASIINSVMLISTQLAFSCSCTMYFTNIISQERTPWSNSPNS